MMRKVLAFLLLPLLVGCPADDLDDDDSTPGDDDATPGDDDMTSDDDDSASGPRTLLFAGREWIVKSGHGGPGPNLWSDSEDSVWLDDEGRLHLRIHAIGGQWHCAEVYTTDTTTFGLHRFYVDGPLDTLDANAVFAPFLYRDDTTEVDIEFTRWGWEDSPTNAQYVVQPYKTPGNLEPFGVSLDGSYTTHSFDWQPDAIYFSSLHGHHEKAPDPSHVIHEWEYRGSDIPHEDNGLRIHINLWLFQGLPPVDGEEITVVVLSAELPPHGP